MGVASCSLSKACVRVAPGIMATAFVATVAMGQQNAHPADPQTARSYFVYVGGGGIYQYRFDEKTGSSDVDGAGGQMKSPSWLATDPEHRYLYYDRGAGQRSRTMPICGVERSAASPSMPKPGR